MPTYYAPCLARVLPTLEYGEELVYPDFEAALPGFFNRDDAEAWLQHNFGPRAQGQTGGNRRVVVDTQQGRLVFLGLRGQNLVFRNVRVTDDQMPVSWADDSSHCLGHMTSTAPWHEGVPQEAQPGAGAAAGAGGGASAGAGAGAGAGTAGGVAPGEWVDEVAMYLTPDSHRFQHWLDHTSKPLVQSAHLVNPATTILAGQDYTFKAPIVQDMWGWLPHINTSRIKRDGGATLARRLITSCRVPYVHPYLFLRLQEMVLGPESPRVPLSQRKVVLWYSRTADDGDRANTGRVIRNEEEVKAAIQQLLKERGLGERLEVHPPAQPFPTPLAYARWLNANVAAMLGPHGGGLCNFKWLATYTLVLELMPHNWLNTALYDDAIGHGLNYWLDVRRSLNGDKDMEASIPNIIALLKAELGKEPRRGPIIRHRYDWPSALDDAYSAEPGREAYYRTLRGRCCGAAPGAPGAEGIHVLEVGTTA